MLDLNLRTNSGTSFAVFIKRQQEKHAKQSKCKETKALNYTRIVGLVYLKYSFYITKLESLDFILLGLESSKSFRGQTGLLEQFWYSIQRIDFSAQNRDQKRRISQSAFSASQGEALKISKTNNE